MNEHEAATLNALSTQSSTSVVAGNKLVKSGEANHDEVVQFNDSGELQTVAPTTTQTAQQQQPPAAQQTQQAQQAQQQTDPNKPLFEVPEVGATVQQQQQQKPDDISKDGKRNYTRDVPEALRPYAKQLNNAEYASFLASVVPAWEKSQRVPELEAKLAERPNHLYEHPNAYLLSPEYSNLVAQQNQASAAANHYRAQLHNALKGRDVVDIVGYDKTTGAPQLQPIPKPPNGWSPEAIETIRSMSLQADLLNTQINNQLTAFHQSAQGQRTQIQAELDNIEKLVFGNFKITDKSEEALHKNTLLKLPPALRSSPLAKWLANAHVAYQRMYAMWQAERAKNTQQAPPVRTTANSAQLSAAGANGHAGDETFNFADSPLAGRTY